MPKFSVIMASFNYEAFIGEAIASVIAQTCPDWELIVWDDGSSDNSLAVIQSYIERDSRVKLYTHPGNVNLGLIATVTGALAECRGEIVAFLESDDKFAPDNLARKLAVFDRYPGVGVVSNQVELFGDAKRMAEYDRYFAWQRREFAKLEFPCNIFKLLLKENFIPTFSCVAIRRDLLLQAHIDGVYPPWLDRYWYLQILYRHDFYFINEVLSFWRMHQSSYIGKTGKAYKQGNNGKIKDMVFGALRGQNMVKCWGYFLLALFCKYQRAISLRCSKGPKT